MSITTAQRARLGGFLIAGVVLLALFVLVPMGFRIQDKYKNYYAYFEGESLSGLEQGATVKYHGIPIGKVEQLSYDPADIKKVKVTIKVQDDFPMKFDMYVQTGMMGITGLMYVEILGGSNDAEELKAGSVLTTKMSTMATITGKADELVAKVELLLNHVNQLTHPDSLRSIKKILDNVAVISEDTKRFMGASGPQFEQMAYSAQSIVTDLDTITRDVKLLTQDLRANFTSGQLASIVSHFDSAAIAINNVATTSNLMLKQSKEDIQIAMENLREAAENANQLSQMLTENPSLLLRGEQQKQRIR